MSYRRVVVSWNDAWSDDDQFDDLAAALEEFEPCVQHTIGFLLKSDKVGVMVAHEINEEDGTIRGTTFIPRGMVVRVRRLR